MIKCDNGIFKYLFEKYRLNPVENGLINIDGKSYDKDAQSMLPEILDSNYNGSYWYSKNEKHSSIKIKFNSSLVKLEITKDHLGITRLIKNNKIYEKRKMYE